MSYDFHITNCKEIRRVTPQHQVQIIAGVVDLVPISGIRFIEIDRCFRIAIYNTDNSFVFNHCSNLQFRVRFVVLWSVKCIYYLLLYDFYYFSYEVTCHLMGIFVLPSVRYYVITSITWSHESIVRFVFACVLSRQRLIAADDKGSEFFSKAAIRVIRLRVFCKFNLVDFPTPFPSTW